MIGRAARVTALLLLGVVVGLLAIQLRRQPRSVGGGEVDPAARELRPAPVSAVLEPGEPIESELGGSEKHVYAMPLAAGDYLQAVVEQRGIDVFITFHDPGGEELARVDSPNGSEGPESLFALAAASGVHRMEVHSWSDEAPSGRYEARIETVRQADSEDRLRVEAERLYEEGYRLRKERTAASLRRAAELLQGAGERFARLPARDRQAVAHYYLGWVWVDLDQPAAAIREYDEALRLFRLLEKPKEVADTLNDLGRAYRLLGDLPAALDHYRQAMVLRRETGDALGMAVTNNNLGRVAALQAEPWEALEFYRAALAGWRNLGDRRAEAIALTNVGTVYEALGKLDLALDQYRAALALRREVGDRRGEAITLTKIGSIHRKRGDHAQTMENLRLALALRREMGDRRGEAVTLTVIGQAHGTMRQPRRALEPLGQALVLFREIQDRFAEACALRDLAWNRHLLGETESAARLYRSALALFAAVGDTSGQAESRYGLARVELDVGDLAAAQASLESTLELTESLRGASPSHDLRSSFLASHSDRYQLYIEVLMRRHQRQPAAGFDRRALEASERARARSLLEMLTEAGAQPKGAGDPGLVARQKALERRLHLLERRRTRVLAAATTRQEEVASISRQLRELIMDLETVQVEIQVQSPAYAALSRPSPATVEEIQRLLDDETALLEYALGEDRSFLWVVTTDAVASFELPPRGAIEAAARRAHEQLAASHRRQARGPAERALRRLGELLLQPAAELLAGRRLVVVGDGALHYVPFAALHVASSGKEPGPVVVSHEIVRLPSASVLRVLRRELAGRPPAPRLLAIFADPVFQPDDDRIAATAGSAIPADGFSQPWPVAGAATGFERLPFAREEAEAILALAPTAFAALGFDAARENVLVDDLGRYRLVHFATHAVLDTDYPQLSGILLSQVDARGRPRNGYLRAHEIYDLDLAADLVVLSACQTALGKEIRGEGMIGLTRGLMYAGAERVLVSLWNVSDRATAHLMRQFYAGMLLDGLRPQAALRQAQISMWQQQEWRAPYYWAGFELHGEWREIED